VLALALLGHCWRSGLSLWALLEQLLWAMRVDRLLLRMYMYPLSNPLLTGVHGGRMHTKTN
jgi:hypothetical protein